MCTTAHIVRDTCIWEHRLARDQKVLFAYHIGGDERVNWSGDDWDQPVCRNQLFYQLVLRNRFLTSSLCQPIPWNHLFCQLVHHTHNIQNR